MQESVPASENAVSFGALNLFIQLGIAISVSACQTVFNNQLPELLQQFSPDVDVVMVFTAGVTGIRKLITPAQMS